MIYNSVVTGLTAGTSLNGIEIENTETHEKRTIKTDGLFIAVGLQPDTGEFADIITLDDAGYVEADESCLTNVPGIFTAGDCRKKSVRQVSTAIADGAAAAVAAIKYLG